MIRRLVGSLLVGLAGAAHGQGARESATVHVGDTIQIAYAMPAADQVCLKPIGNQRVVVLACGRPASVFLRSFLTKGGLTLNTLSADSVTLAPPVVIPPPPPVVDTTAMFSTSFENGFGKLEVGTGDLTLTSVNCHSGSSCVDIALPQGACCNHMVTLEANQIGLADFGKVVDIKYWVRFSKGFQFADDTSWWGGASNCPIPIPAGIPACGNMKKTVYLYGAIGSGNNYLDFAPPCDPGLNTLPINGQCPNASFDFITEAPGSVSVYGGNVTPSADTLWHSIEFFVDGPNSHAKVWYDGNLVIDTQQPISVGSGYRIINVGLYENNRIPFLEHMYLDDVCIKATRCP